MSPLHSYREPTYDAEFQHFLRGKEMVLNTGSTPKIQGLTMEQAEAVVRLSCLPAFKDLIAKVQADEVSGRTSQSRAEPSPQCPRGHLFCPHSNLASGWTAAPRSRRCPTSGARTRPRVSALGMASPAPGRKLE